MTLNETASHKIETRLNHVSTMENYHQHPITFVIAMAKRLKLAHVQLQKHEHKD